MAAARLRRAIERDELELHWQGIHRASDRRVMGSEALVRWRHPEVGMIYPGDFVPLAERTGIIEALGDWLMRAVCRQAAEWETRGLAPKLGMNVSPRQLRRRGFAARLADEVARHGIAPERIVFELTESAWVLSSDTLKPVLDEVGAAGMMFAVDDFGAGYSSLSRLRELPAEIIKIDRAFLRGAPADPQATEILLGILRIAAATGADVTVEGVETEEQLELLEAHGFRFLRGFLLSRPVPAEQFEPALRGAIVPERSRYFATLLAADGRPEAEAVARAHQQAPVAAQDQRAGGERLPPVPPAAAPAPGLPALRVLRRARGRRDPRARPRPLARPPRSPSRSTRTGPTSVPARSRAAPPPRRRTACRCCCSDRPASSSRPRASR
jgi:EAL domain-containing protein (putative c-di-GMP-specific phosphodiesterase class I)